MNLSKEQLPPYIVGSLNCSGIVYGAAELNRALEVYRRVLGNGFYHVPFFLVADLLILLEQGYEVRFRSEKENKGDDENLLYDRKLIMRYERECLGRILQSTEVTTAMEIAATSPDFPKVIERLLLQILRSLAPHYPDTDLLNPGLLRDYFFPDPLVPTDFDASEFYPSIERFLGELNAHVNWGQLLFDEDIFELTHLASLGTDHLRVGCRQILEVSRLLRSPDPIQLDLATHEDGADTSFVDETHYPTGGLAGLTNRGSFENLLTSELVYLDEGTKDVSLFELRYAEGELLYYLRDSGNLRRKRRSIHFILDVSDIFESKLPGYQWQYSVLLQGICLRLLHDLFEVFEMDALRFHFHYIESSAAPVNEAEFFEGEIGVMKTVLSDYVKHEWVTFETRESVQLPDLIDPKRKTYAVVLAGPETVEKWAGEMDRLTGDEAPIHCALISANEARDENEFISLPRGGLNVVGLVKVKDAVLKKLVS